MKRIIYIVLMIFMMGGSLAAQFHAESFVPKEEVIIAYKNASRDVLVVKTTQQSMKIKSIAIFDILGTQVAQFSTNTNSMEIDLSRLRNGKYLMSYSLNDNTQKVKQIIKQ
ncbi:T9SS type A sorting domain-containing protein [Bergeyella zoohelcum]|uniref:T9SS type A sorting domain-containing protein n=1 Tax=Bergeyella zoohelcum TaxID=1015 RepID=UPI001FEA43DA|nr:T9SS type A sorting domain-containing protein [Bergeyella zoohelcum]MDY6026160.1 T9SS type A sorting domain-containing protein [Bergeyella zoohelcum]